MILIVDGDRVPGILTAVDINTYYQAGFTACHCHRFTVAMREVPTRSDEHTNDYPHAFARWSFDTLILTTVSRDDVELTNTAREYQKSGRLVKI